MQRLLQQINHNERNNSQMIDAMDGMSEKDSLRERRLSDLRNQSNLQLLEQIRMNS